MSIKSDVLSALENAEGNYISGSFLAGNLGVSRNSVWKAVNSLKKDGFKIESSSNNGYKLICEISPVYQNRFNKYLNTDKLGRNLICLHETDSTNTYAKKLAHDGAEHGTTVISEIQTSGRGRMGRVFTSPPDTGLYISVIIKIPIKSDVAQLITACTAVSVAQAIDEICGTECQIKWVNDIFLNGKKICGILTEASISFENGTLDFAVIGTGINVYSVKNKFNSELLEIASSIEDECGIKADRSRLAAEILNKLEKNLNELETHKFINEYKRRSCIIGHDVIVTKGNSERIGYACDIDDTACLIVKYQDGTQEALNSGETRIIRK